MKATVFYCSECEIEFRVKHEVDDQIFVVKYCPFCAVEVDEKEQYSIDE